MPDANLTAAQKEAYALASVDEVTLVTIEISHPVAGEVYLVQDKQALTATLEDARTVTFEPVPFRMTEPTQGESGAVEMNITIDNVDRRISRYIKNVRGSQQVTTIKRRLFLASDTSQPQTVEPYELTATEILVGTLEVTIVATFVDVLNRVFPNRTYARKTFPSLGD